MRAPTASLALLLCGCPERLEVPARPPKANPTNDWGALLESAASEDGVDYARIAAERDVLERYLAWVGEHGPLTDNMRESAEDKRLAFLFNAYNAWVIYAVLEHDGIDSVRDVSRWPYSMKPGATFFLGTHVRVDSEWLSLYHLEAQSIVDRYQDPLLHMGLNCASKGCPPIRYWKSSKLQSALERSMRDWLAGPALEKTPTGYAANEIFFWHEDDFMDWSQANDLCEWMAPYAAGERQEWLEAHVGDCTLERVPYDWSLNRSAPTAP